MEYSWGFRNGVFEMSITKDLLIDPSKDGAIVETTNVTIRDEIDKLLDTVDEKILSLKLPKYIKRELSWMTYKFYSRIESDVDTYTPKSEA